MFNTNAQRGNRESAEHCYTTRSADVKGRMLSSLSAMNCVSCDKSELESRLHKCPICFRWICEDCGKRDYGRTFCSQRCADQFFFGDDEG